MKRIIEISEENYNHLCFLHEDDIYKIVENSTPLNECEAEDLQKYTNALRKCAKEHENDFVGTGKIRTSDLCNDTANLLERLAVYPKSDNPKLSINMKCSNCMASGCDMCVLEPTMWQFDSDKVEEQGDKK